MVDQSKLQITRSHKVFLLPIFIMLDRRIAFALNKAIQNSHFEGKVSVQEKMINDDRGGKIGFGPRPASL